MKKYFIPFLLMAAAAVAACQPKENIEEPSLEGSYIYTLSASVPEVTKSDYDASGAFSWSASDQISVLFHKGDDNKFFTLSNTSGAGASATFSGAIDAGYEIGASTDGTQWALYPAGDHKVRFTESDGEKYPISFNIPAVTDYTTAPFSANIPMYAQGDGSTFEFKHLGAAYKFTFTDIDNSISKAKFVVQNQTTYRLSGDVKLRNQGGTYLDQAWADGVDKTLTYIREVSNGTVEFYVPVRYYAACFQPVITLYNAENDDVIFTKTASVAKGIEDKGHVQPIVISVSGAVITPWSYESAFGVDWDDSTVASDAGQTGFNKISFVADNTYLYMLAAIQKAALEFNADNYRENSVNFYVNEQSVAYGFLAKQGNPQSNDNSSYVVGSNVTEHKDVMYYEWKIDRAAAAAKDAKLAPLGEIGFVNLRLCVFPKVGVNSDWSALSTTDWSVYMYAPASGSISVNLP